MATLRQQIAQMLMMGFSGLTIEDNSPVSHWLREEKIGGVILFDYDLNEKRPGKNLSSREQIKQLTSKLQTLCLEQECPPFIAIDYEGGMVDRLKDIAGCPKTLSPKALCQYSDEERRLKLSEMAQTLKELGFNLNFAPVVDLDLNNKTGIIGKLERSFSERPALVSRMAKQFVKAFWQEGILCCYKHFPGHGSAKGDTHDDFVDVTEQFALAELEPYQQLAKETIPTLIMTAHVVNRKLDVSGLPATLSKPMLTNLLRQELGFNGVIISDDLQMQAITKQTSLEKAIDLSINAGADMLIFANQLGTITAVEVIDKIEAMVAEKKISLERIATAYQRIIQLKQILKAYPQLD